MMFLKEDNMAQTTEPKQRYGTEEFPVRIEKRGLRVFENPSGELFVEDIRSGTQMRMSSYPHGKGGIEFTTDQLVEPIRVTNTIGWRVGPR
jgi:hypothetical protein